MAAAFGAMVVAAAGVGCRSGHQAEAKPLVIAVSGDTHGWIVPCGCAASQSGGLPRRGTYVRHLRRSAQVIVADVGGAPSGTSAYDRFKFEILLRGEMAMGVAAHNLGRAELRLGPRYLRRLAREQQVPWVSANVVDAGGSPLAEPMRVVRAGRRRVALVGVVDPQAATDEVRITPPVQAVLKTLAGAAEPYDAVVVLAYLEEDALRRLAEMLPEVDVVVGGPTGQPIRPVAVGPTLLTSATNKGKFIARLDAPERRNPDRWQGRIVELDARFEDDPEQLALLEQFYRQLAERDFAPQETSFAWAGGDGASLQVAGTTRCAECHEAEFQIWADSNHAEAWQSLRRQGTHVDPACQRCHTTGYGLPGGFASLAQQDTATNVGCESCHGPSLRHADEPEIPTAYAGQARRHCPDCHDRENSPDFEYHRYWTQIEHGAVGGGAGVQPAGRGEESR